MFFFYDAHTFYMLSSEVDLRNYPYLRLLEFQFNLNQKKMRKFQDNVIGWFNAICESITSKSLVVVLYMYSEDVEICEKIQDTLLALHERMETFLVYLSPLEGDVEEELFPELEEMGIAVYEDLWEDWDKLVSYEILTPYLLYLLISHLESSSFPPMSFYSTPKSPAVHIQMYVSTCD